MGIEAVYEGKKSTWPIHDVDYANAPIHTDTKKPSTTPIGMFDFCAIPSVWMLTVSVASSYPDDCSQYFGLWIIKCIFYAWQNGHIFMTAF